MHSLPPQPDDLLTPPVPDRLGVLSATAQVMHDAKFVRLIPEAIETLASRWASQPWPEQPPFDETHQSGTPDGTANWVLLLDALNFCFWSEAGRPRWRVAWGGETLNGYAALAAALSRASAEGVPLTNARWLSGITQAKMAHILRPAPGSPDIPLLASRAVNAREVGEVLLANYDGQCANVVAAAKHDAVALALLLAQDFTSFADVADWRGTPVPFLKRAQIFAADLHAACHGEAPGDLTSLDELTAFADYKLPQLLRHEGVLVYAPALAHEVDSQLMIPMGAAEEVEIRAGTIWAVELLRRELDSQGITRTAPEIDFRIWLDSQRMPSDALPYHRTRTIYY